MTNKAGSQTKSSIAKPNVSLSQPGILQRLCDCGAAPGLTGKCETCNSQRLSRKQVTHLSSSYQDSSSPTETIHTSAEQPLRHNFSNISVQPQSKTQIQTKLTIGQPNDEYEQEADRVAAQVISMPTAHPQPRQQKIGLEEAREDIQKKTIVNEITPIKNENIPEQSSLQRATIAKQAEDSKNELDNNLENRLNSSSGSSLPDDVQTFMEDRFGTDFSNVRVHTGDNAVQMNRALNAQAFTHQQDIYFGAGKFPGKDALTAHELTHVVQQTGTTVQRSLIQMDRGSDPIHQRMIDNYRRWRGLPPGGVDEFGNQVGPSDAEIKYGDRRDPPLTSPEVENRLIGECLRLANGQQSMLQQDYVQTALAGRAQNSTLSTAFNNAVQRIGQDSFDTQMGRIEAEAPGLMALMEAQFINDPNTSSLDLLPPNQRQRYRNFAWGRNDYPGGAGGANEGRANQMANALSQIRPERRVNQGSSAVVNQSEYNAAMRRYIQSELREIPDFPAPAQGGQAHHQPGGERLNQYALQDFLAMRQAALQDGVAIIVIDSYRSPERAARNAARSGNPAAVASFSPHMLGLAIDIQMSYRQQTASGTTAHNYAEATTTPMQNVVNMRQSPAHKWMFIHGATYGWYPYQNEPWHWEYNPDGFRDTFRQNLNPAGRSSSGSGASSPGASSPGASSSTSPSSAATPTVQPKRELDARTTSAATSFIQRQPQPGATPTALHRVLPISIPGSQSLLANTIQRQWSDAASGGARSTQMTPPATGWNAAEVAVGRIRRIPVQGLTQGNQSASPHDAAVEAANGRAIVLVPDNLDASRPVEVLLHLHGHNIGYRQRSRRTSNPGTVRDVEVDRIEQQLQASGRPMIGILPQGTTKSGFGGRGFNSDAYIQEIFTQLSGMGIWGQNATAPQIQRVVLTGHSGAGGPISQMMNEPGQPRLPSNLGEVALYDAINGDGELAIVRRWVLAQLDRDLAELTRPGITAADQSSYLDRSLRFRAYHTVSEYYGPRHTQLKQAIDGWFSRHESVLGGTSSPVYTRLRDHYQVISVGHGNHDAIMGRGDRLQDALGALPAITSPTPANAGQSTPQPAPNSSNSSGQSQTVPSPPSAHSSSNSMDAGVPAPIRDAGIEDIHGVPEIVQPKLRMSQPTIQRSPLSDAVEKVWTDTSNHNAVWERLSRPDAKAAAQDPDLIAALTRIFPNPDDRWVAERILAGKLGDTTGIVKGKKGTPHPIEVYFFQGQSSERALIIAGVHGTERQGVEVAQMLISNLQNSPTMPYYSVIIVPTLFPDNYHHKSKKDPHGLREEATPTNRNFPDGGRTLAGATKDKQGRPVDKNDKPILPENIMLMELMERFRPSRIISIHGTQYPARAGVFSDPHFISPAKQLELHGQAWSLAAEFTQFMQPPPRFPQTRESQLFELADRIYKQLLIEAQKTAAQRTKDDAQLALAAAYAIADKTKDLDELQQRKLSKALKQHPAVAGNRLDRGKGKETATWPGETDEGVSLGSYAPGRGMSVFTVEPAINRNTGDYPAADVDAKVSAAQRKMELQAYADVIQTLLLGDPTKTKTP